MKSKLSILIATVALLLSCNRDDFETQTIDQIIHLYMKNTDGQDLFNPKLEGSYTSVALLDLLDETDLKNFSGYSMLKDQDTINYLEYTAGAIRLIKDSLSPEQKTYYSKFVIRLSKIENEAPIIDDDTIQIEYNWTPSLFQVSKLYYNDGLKFTKTQGQANVITIVK